MPDGATIYGGFAGTETSLDERDWRMRETILSGDIGVTGDLSDNAATVVYCGSSVEAALDGVSIVDGYAHASGYYTGATYGAGVYNLGSLTLTNATVRDNSTKRRRGGRSTVRVN